MDSIVKNIGSQIRILRKSQNFSQEELAEKANLHPTYIGQVERGEKNLTISSLTSITIALNISLEEFFSLIELNNNTQNSIDKTPLPYQNILYLLQDMDIDEQKAMYSLILELIKWKQS